MNALDCAIDTMTTRHAVEIRVNSELWQELNHFANEEEARSFVHGLPYLNLRIMSVTPSVVATYAPIFVFGSNMLGLHVGGAALVAAEQHGAQHQRGCGPSGNAYAIPTMTRPGGSHLPIEVIRECVWDFIGYAAAHPDVTFMVTAVGTGIAGFRHESIAPLFKTDLLNVRLPRPWHKILFGAHKPERESFEF